MSTIPTGRPAWARSVSHTDYGGFPTKKNYQSQGVTNPRTDVGAEAYCRLAADAEACTRTAPFAVITFLNNDTGTDPPTVESAYLMTGVTTAGYEGDAPATGFPGGVRNGSAHTTWTFAATYEDAYETEEAFTPRFAQVFCHGSTFASATATISGSTVVVRVFDAAGSALDDVRVTLVVW